MTSHNVYNVNVHKREPARDRASETPDASSHPPYNPPSRQGPLSLSEVAAALQAGDVLRDKADEVTTAWSHFLMRFPLDWFCTFTFRRSIHPEAADKRFRVWVSKLNRHLYGVRWYQKAHTQVFWIRALELQRRDVIHYHALVGDCLDLNNAARRMRFIDIWYDIAGIARIDPISNLPEEQLKAVTGYVSKYVAKGGEIELSPSMRWYLQKSEMVTP